MMLFRRHDATPLTMPLRHATCLLLRFDAFRQPRVTLAAYATLTLR